MYVVITLVYNLKKLEVIFGTILKLNFSLTLYHVGPPLALSAAILWGMHQPIPNFLTFPNYISTFIW